MTPIREGGVEIPAGMKLVPIEPTHEMLLAGDAPGDDWWDDEMPLTVWRRMLAAYTPTPSPEIAEQPETVEGWKTDELHAISTLDRLCADRRHYLAPADRALALDAMLAFVASHPTPAGASMPDDAVERIEHVANAIANADLDCPDPEDYWFHLATAAIRALATNAPDAAKREGEA